MSTLAVEGLRVRLPTPAGDVTVVDGVDYEVQPAEVFGIAGESGSGKTVSMLALLGLLPEGSTVEGSARFGDDDLIAISRRRLQSISGRDIAMVFQDPYTSLHPMLSVGKQLTEHVGVKLELHRVRLEPGQNHFGYIARRHQVLGNQPAFGYLGLVAVNQGAYQIRL